jgi:transposase-like protein
MRVRFNGAPGAKESLLTCVRGAVASPLRYRQLEERRRARGGTVDHAPRHRSALTRAPHNLPPIWVRAVIP